MTKRRTSSQQRKHDETKAAIVKITIAFSVLGIVAWFYINAMLSTRTLDMTTMCPSVPDSVTVVLVDVTDPLNLPQKQDFTNQLDLLVEKVPRYGKLVIAKVDPVSERLLTPVITRCNPGSSEDANDISGNPAKLEAMHKMQFVAPVQAAFAQITTASEALRSPILESIQSINLTELQRGVAKGGSRKLIVASDLLQHTQDISFYKRLPDADALVATPAFGRVRTDLRGTEVELWMLQRADFKSTQPRQLPELWEKMIDAQGGKLMRVYNVSG